MLGDMYRVYKSEEAKRAGTANPSGGRRKSHINGNLDELWKIMTPRFSTLPFHLALAELQDGRSLRAFALKAGIDFRVLSHMVRWSSGAAKRPYPLTRQDLEQMAKAGGVHPAFFVEWRLFVVQDLINEIFANQPNLSISLLRALGH